MLERASKGRMSRLQDTEVLVRGLAAVRERVDHSEVLAGGGDPVLPSPRIAGFAGGVPPAGPPRRNAGPLSWRLARGVGRRANRSLTRLASLSSPERCP